MKYHRKFLKEYYQTFRIKMKNVLLHYCTDTHLYNLNNTMNRLEIQQNVTQDNMVELLHCLEQDRRRNFSLPAFMDHLDSVTNPEGTPATTNLWLTQSTGFESKTSLAKIINSDNYINKMHKLMHLPLEIISTIGNGDALH